MKGALALEQVTWPAMLVAVAMGLAAVATYTPAAALGAAAALIAVMLVARDANNALLLSLVILPLTYSPLLDQNLLGIPGMKVTNLALAATLGIAILKGGLLRSSDRIERGAMLALGIYLLLFTLAFVRSVPNLAHFYDLLPLQFDRDAFRYTLSVYVRSALFIVPFVFILKHMKDQPDRVLLGLSLAIFALSCVLIFGVARDPGVLAGGRSAIALLCDRYLGLHYNTVGTFYLTAGPLLVYLARGRGLFGVVNLALAVVVILLLQSRSALLVFALTAAITLILIRRTRFLVIGSVVVALASGIWLGPTATALLSIGIDNGSVYSLDELFTGRVAYIWMPLLQEWFSDPMLFLFGAGRYGILTTPLWANGQILRVGHAHNAFIDFFLDSGAVLTAVAVGAVIAWLVWGWRKGRALRNPLYWALYLCTVAYLAGTLTGRQFWPGEDNMLLFPIIALLVNVVRTAKARVAARPHVPYRLVSPPHLARLTGAVR